MKNSLWKKFPIEAICKKVTSGSTPLRSNFDYFEGGQIRWVKTQELKDWYIEDTHEKITEKALRDTSVKLYPPETVLMAMYGDGRTITSLGILRKESTTNQACCAMIVNSDLCEPLFLFYSLKHYRTNFIKLASGGAQRNLNTQVIRNFWIPLPHKSIQNKIIGVLSNYDYLIENNTRRIQILEEMAQTIYREWFVHFRFPGHEGVRMVDSPLGMIPEGWEIDRLDHISDLDRGKSYRSDNLVEEGGLPFLNLKCIERGGGFRVNGIKRFSGDYKKEQSAKPGDIIIAVTDMTQERRIVAHAARVPGFRESLFVMSMDIVKLVPKLDQDYAFLYSQLRYSNFSKEVSQFANGTNVLHLSPERIIEYKFIHPPSVIRKQFGTLIDPLFRLSDILSQKNDILHQQRDLLLPRLMSGELNVENIPSETGTQEE